jgi:hypothetical protein
MESPRPKFADVANILMQLIAQGGGSEALDPLYDLISEHPASTQFTAEQGRDALLVAVARVVQIIAGGRRHIAEGEYHLASRDLEMLTAQFNRIATLAAFLERSGREALKAHAEGRPAGPLNPFNAPRE